MWDKVKAKASAAVAGLSTVGAIDVNWTELTEVFGEIMDLLASIIDKLPGIIVKIAVVVIILLMLGFATKLFDKILKMIKI